MDCLQLSSAAKTVLYVEDHPVNALIMRAMFERCPALCLVVAETVAEALDVARGLNPVLLLLDLRLPDGNGHELLRLLRVIPGCESAPAVAVTAEDDFELQRSGFVEVWSKPLHLDAVLRRLDAMTGGLDGPLEQPGNDAGPFGGGPSPSRWPDDRQVA